MIFILALNYALWSGIFGFLFFVVDRIENTPATAATFQQSMTGRWVTLDAGDVDGDGDDDIVLGSMTEMPGSFPPPQLKEYWDKRGPSIVILRNVGKKASQ